MTSIQRVTRGRGPARDARAPVNTRRTVLIVAPEDVVRLGLQAIYAADELAVERVIGLAALDELWRALDHERVDLVVVDQALVSARDLARLPVGRFLLVASHPDGELLRAAQACGAAAYLTLRTPAALFHAQLRAAPGGFLLDPLLQSWMAPLAPPRPAMLVEGLRLTRREREITRLLDQGLDRHMVARRLGITEATLKSHLHHVAQERRARATAAPPPPPPETSPE